MTTQLEKKLTDSDPANYTGESVAAGIQISKTPHYQKVHKGKRATFTIKVTNTGDVALHNVRVTDAAAPNCARTIGNLAAGATVEYTCTVAHVKRSFRNVAVARGTTPTGGPVADSDSATVRVKHKPRPPCPPPPPHPCKHHKHHCKCDGHDGHHKPCPPPHHPCKHDKHHQHHCKCDGRDGHHRPCRPHHPHLPNTGGSPLGVLVAGFGATAGGALLSGMWFVRRRRAQLR